MMTMLRFSSLCCHCPCFWPSQILNRFDQATCSKCHFHHIHLIDSVAFDSFFKDPCNYVWCFIGFYVGRSTSSPLNPIQILSYYDDDITQFQLTILLLFSISKFPFDSSPLFCCCFALLGEDSSITPTVTSTVPSNSSPSMFSSLLHSTSTINS